MVSTQTTTGPVQSVMYRSKVHMSNMQQQTPQTTTTHEHMPHHSNTRTQHTHNTSFLVVFSRRALPSRTPRASVSYGGSSASGTRPSITTRTAQDTDTSDVKRGTGPELAQGVIQPSSSGDTGDDVAMKGGENAGERSAGDSNPSGPDSRRRITTERAPREARDEQSIATSQHPEEDVREDAGSRGSCHHAGGIGRVA